MIPSIEDCRTNWRKMSGITAMADTWWKDEDAMIAAQARGENFRMPDSHMGFLFMDSKYHPTAFLCLLAIVNAAGDRKDGLVQFGLADVGFFLDSCDDGYIDLLQVLCPENEALRFTLGYVYRHDNMSDERYRRICTMAPSDDHWE